MKTKLFLLMLSAIVTVSACKKKQALTPSGKSSNVTLNLSIEGPSTRAVNVTRYIVEIYNATDMATRLHRIEQAAGTVVLPLDNSQNYTALIWADGVAVTDNTNGVFNALDLKNVTLNTGKTMAEAFFAKASILGTVTTHNITLARPVAEVNLIETATLTANTDLVVTYDQFNSFNTNTSAVVGSAVSTTHTFNSALTTGTMGTFMTFASTIGIVTNFTAVYNATTTNQILNVPLKANYITNISGDFATGQETFTINVTINENYEASIPGVYVNVGTTAAPAWIEVADRNADKNGPFGAASGNGASDYGYYYMWGTATTAPNDTDKSYRACFDMDSGNGLWRQPTNEEFVAISGSTGNNQNDNTQRKIQWGIDGWRLYDERVGKTTEFVSFPRAGYRDGSAGTTGTHLVGSQGTYVSSTPTGSYFYNFIFDSNGYSDRSMGAIAYGRSVRCVRSVTL